MKLIILTVFVTLNVHAETTMIKIERPFSDTVASVYCPDKCDEIAKSDVVIDNSSVGTVETIKESGI